MNWPRPIKGRRSDYGHISGLRLDLAARGEAWPSLPYRPVFVGDTETRVLHGGVVPAMLDESCGMAVQLALDGTSGIATLTWDGLPEAGNARPRHQGPFGRLPRHAVDRLRTRHRLQKSEDDPVATATACHDRREPRNMSRSRMRFARCRRWKRRRIRKARSPTARSRVASASASMTMAG